MDKAKLMSMTLVTLSQAVGKKLKEQGAILATAESCSGGGLGFWVTSVEASSDWFDRGFITYSDAAKIELLGVNPVTLETYGAVSEETVREMAEGALKKSYADTSIAITGIAGPSGGTAEKPVGTVWIAWARRGANTKVSCECFSGDRQRVREQTIEKALRGLL